MHMFWRVLAQSDGDVAAGMGFGAIALGGTMAVDRGATAGTQSRRDGSEGTGFSPPKRRNGRNSAERRARKRARYDSSASHGDLSTPGHPTHRCCSEHGASRGMSG